MSKRIVLRRIAGPLIALLAIFGCNNAIKDRLDDINGYPPSRVPKTGNTFAKVIV